MTIKASCVVSFPMNSSQCSQSDPWTTKSDDDSLLLTALQHKFKFFGSTCPSLHDLSPVHLQAHLLSLSHAHASLTEGIAASKFFYLPMFAPTVSSFQDIFVIMLTSIHSLDFTLLLSNWETFFDYLRLNEGLCVPAPTRTYLCQSKTSTALTPFVYLLASLSSQIAP